MNESEPMIPTMKSLVPSLLAVLFLGAAAAAQPAGYTDVSAQDAEYDEEAGIGRLRGDVNVIQAGTRLRADEADVYFTTSQGGAREITRIDARGEVFYVTAAEIARGDRGSYDVATETVTLIGDVVITQGCNVSTGQRLVSNMQTGVSQLFGSADGSGGGRVRSLFVSGDQAAAETGDCPRPEIPGDGPIAFEPVDIDEDADIELDEDGVLDRLGDPD
jgi:lipopolysaccharide export system protein LptA